MGGEFLLGVSGVNGGDEQNAFGLTGVEMW